MGEMTGVRHREGHQRGQIKVGRVGIDHRCTEATTARGLDTPNYPHYCKVSRGARISTSSRGYCTDGGCLRGGGGEEGAMTIEQLVLPAPCHPAIMAIAHEIPLSRHLGKTKTAQRIFQRFYWPTLHADVARFCW